MVTRLKNKQTVEQLQAELEAKIEQLKQFQSKVEQLESALAKLEAENADLIEERNDLAEERDDLKRIVDELKYDRDALLQTVEKAVDGENDSVNHPAHYTTGKIECIDAIEAATVGLTGGQAYCTGVAIKYLWRWSRKGGVEDLRKARWYIDRLIEELEGNVG